MWAKIIYEKINDIPAADGFYYNTIYAEESNKKIGIRFNICGMAC